MTRAAPQVAAVADADLRVLLMAVFQLSGDRTWLAPPYQPTRDVRLIADEAAGLSPAAAADIRQAALELIGTSPAVEDPGNELIVEMMSHCLGEPVPPEYAPMIREELGFVSRDIEWPANATWPADPVLIVGAGVSGIVMAVRLARLGVPYTIVEKRADVGGVWRDNRYPGAGVDTPNHAYSFSFTKPHRWSRFFAPREEIARYIESTAEEFGVTEHIEFDTAVRRATWSEAARCWHVALEGPNGTEVRRAPALISAIGQLNEPKFPPLDTSVFEGRCFHSADWPTDLDIADRRVAVIGTGASAMQIVPTIASVVSSLTVVQRSPQWARPIPRYHDPIPLGSQWLLEHFPFYAPWFRFTMLWRYGDGLLRFLHKDPDWPHPERSLNRINDRHRREMTDHIASQLDGHPALIANCIPDYPPYGKRMLLDNGWYETLTQPHVELVAGAVDSLTTTGFVTDDGAHHEADIIVFATGFHVTEMAAALDITGRDGVNLRETWADENPTAYLGITVPGFPNLFLLQGPNTGLGHGGSAIFQSECQARHISHCLATIAATPARTLRTIEPTREAHSRYTAAVDREHERLIWTHPGMETYYRNRHGRVVSVMPWRLVDYWEMTHDIHLEDYSLG